jgi:S1-C subfamily serine protease
MNNKIILAILALLLVIAAGGVYYSYTLSQRLDSLDRTLSAYQAEQASRISGVSDNLAEFREETGNRLDSLGSQLTGTGRQVDSLSSGLTALENKVSDVETGLSGQVKDLGTRLDAVETKISTSIFSPAAAYRKVSPATVRITDGLNVIGSGFIYDAQDHVVTAYHVIEGLTPIIAITDDGRIFTASVTGYSQISDVAVLKLNGDPAITPPVLGDSSRIQIGEPVVAIGSPLDIRDTLTAGVISQVNRYANYGADNNWVPSLLQFDAPVNPGNSGGPLANGAGEVIGVVVARINASQGDGIYYAVASNKVKRVADAVIGSGSFPYPWLGVTIIDLTPEEAQAKGLETANGINVVSVNNNGPAQSAGIRAGDIIVSINGMPVRDTAELTSYLGENLSPGDETVIEVLRGSSHLEMTVQVGTR